MKDSEHLDDLVDMLLREVVGGESPPDVRARVLNATRLIAGAPHVVRRPAVRIPQRRKSFPVFAMAAALAFLMCVLALLGSRRIANARTPVVVAQNGQVEVPAGGLAKDRILTTSEASGVTFAWMDGTRVEVGPAAEVRFPRARFWERAKTIELVKGMIRAEVTPQPKGAPLRIGTADASVVVLGTQFSLTRKYGMTRLEVTEGRVRFDSAIGTGIVVNAGSFAEAKQGEAMTTGGIADKSECVVRGFTLMDADTDLAIRDLTDGEAVSLSALPSPRISIRSDFDGDAPVSMILNVTRDDKKHTGIITYEHPSLPPQSHAPYFVTGDYSSFGRSADAQPWTPRPGKYRVEATPLLNVNGEKKYGKKLSIHIEIAP